MSNILTDENEINTANLSLPTKQSSMTHYRTIFKNCYIYFAYAIFVIVTVTHLYSNLFYKQILLYGTKQRIPNIWHTNICNVMYQFLQNDTYVTRIHTLWMLLKIFIIISFIYEIYPHILILYYIKNYISLYCKRFSVLLPLC